MVASVPIVNPFVLSAVMALARLGRLVSGLVLSPACTLLRTTAGFTPVDLISTYPGVSAVVIGTLTPVPV